MSGRLRRAEKKAARKAARKMRGNDESPEPICNVLSSTNKLKLTTQASFGDALDIYYERPSQRSGSTEGTINVRRNFEPGDYLMHILEINDTEKPKRVAILCLDNLSPVKIHNMLQKSNFGEEFEASNYINRYDWMTFRNWEINSFWSTHKAFVKTIKRDIFKEHVEVSDSDSGTEENDDVDNELWKKRWKFKNMIYFVDANHLVEIRSGRFRCEPENEWIHVMKGVGNNEDLTIGFIIVIKDGSGLIYGDWHYGCVLVDRQSEKCFGFVFEDYYTINALDPTDELRVNIGKINYTFDKTYFKN